MKAEIITALIRHLLTAFGGGLAVRYGVDGQAFDVIAGGVAAAAGVAWSVYDKKKRVQ